MAADPLKDEELPATLTASGGSPENTDKSISNRIPWGRLVPHRSFLRAVDLIAPFTFGRGEQCSVIITAKYGCSQNFIFNLSKLHFRIDKDSEDNLVYITDLSKNGTFVNGEKLGRGNRKILKHVDDISVSIASKTIYRFLVQGSEGMDNFLPQELFNRFATVRLLGRGSCGEVRLVKDRNTLEQFAIKKMILGESNSSLMHKINHPEKIFREIDILKSLSHPFIINMADIVRVDREIYLVLEYMSGGELTKRILNQPMTQSIAKFYFMQLIYATEYLHSKGILHRDLKPENILLYDDREETLLKITDFGLSKITHEDPATTRCGTLRYVAPEVINNGNYDYGKEVDVWSLGVILYFMLSRDFPFGGEQDMDIVKNILKCKYNLSEGFWSDNDTNVVKDLIKKMLRLNPKDRIMISEIMDHPWIEDENNVKYRIDSLIEDLEVPMEHLFLGPPRKRFKSERESVSSDETNVTLTSGNSGSNSGYSSNSTICC